jgi:hypothetical protein
MATPRGLIRQLRRVQADAYQDLQQQVWRSQRDVRRVIQDAAMDTPNLVNLRAQRHIFREIGKQWDGLADDLEGFFRDLTLRISPTFQEAAIERMMRPGRPVASTITRYSRERAERVFEMIHPANGDRIAGIFTDKMTEANLNALRNAVIESQRAGSVEGWPTRRVHKEIQERWSTLARGMVPRVETQGFTDISGRNWDNARYLNMLTRTTTARIARESYMQTLLDAGDDLMRIEAVGDTCPVCMAWDGLIVSMSGTNPDFPSYQDAIQAGWGHPNCDCLLTSVDETLDKQEVETQEEVENVDWAQRDQVAKYREKVKG